MSDWTDSDGEKDNCDDFEPPKKHQKPKLSSPVLGKKLFTELVPAEEMESISKGFFSKNTAKKTKWAVSTFRQWIIAQNECTSLGENVDVDILSRPVDKDSNCTELCHVLCLFVVPIIQYLCIVPSALFGAVQSMCKCLTTNRFRTVLDLLPVHGTHMLQLSAWICCIICLLYYLLGDFQCLLSASFCPNSYYPNCCVLIGS